MFITQLAVILAAGTLSFLLRFDFSIPAFNVPHLQVALGVWLFVKFLAMAAFRIDRSWWRYISIHDLPRLGMANLAGSAASFVILYVLLPGFPRSIYLLDMILCFFLMAGVRLGARAAGEISRVVLPGAEQKTTLIYGAGDAGVSLLREIRQNQALPYRVVGFMDDDPAKKGMAIHGVKVYGGGPHLADIAQRYGVEMVLIAMPSVSGRQMTEILKHCHEAGVSYKTIPGLAEVLSGTGLLRQIRDVAVEDLLRREPVRIDQEGIRTRIEGRVVLVTGAAGSIGSELCRQVAPFRPKAIVGLELAETALFEMDREMKTRFPGVPFHPEIGSIQNFQRVSEVIRRHNPSLLYHAAAYKHVPMMEMHVFEAVENNVFGTHNVARAATEAGVTDFVLISSDKAVRPTSVMGATKQVAERLILALGAAGAGRTNFVSVRFGNVLDSSGSVIRIFRDQIAAGGPVTVTHPEMRRYFMTIPEAAQLVVQASAMGKAGEIFVLDMGESVRIADLAREMILLSGLRPDEDVKIEMTGMRPGEKLYEELHMLDENLNPTFHDKIKIFAAAGDPSSDMGAQLALLRDICERRDLPALVMFLKEIVPDYNPSSHLLRRIMDGQHTGGKEMNAREPVS